jgi:hypothetical protein
MKRRGIATCGVVRATGLALLAAGCGGASKSPSIANLATTSSSGGKGSVDSSSPIFQAAQKACQANTRPS